MGIMDIANSDLRNLAQLLQGPNAKTLSDISDITEFSGKIYENQDIATADTARRFETIETKLKDVIIQVTTYGQLFGDVNNQRYNVAAGRKIGFTQVDLSTLYFKNATAGQNGVVNILGVKE